MLENGLQQLLDQNGYGGMQVECPLAGHFHLEFLSEFICLLHRAIRAGGTAGRRRINPQPELPPVIFSILILRLQCALRISARNTGYDNKFRYLHNNMYFRDRSERPEWSMEALWH